MLGLIYWKIVRAIHALRVKSSADLRSTHAVAGFLRLTKFHAATILSLVWPGASFRTPKDNKPCAWRFVMAVIPAARARRCKQSVRRQAARNEASHTAQRLPPLTSTSLPIAHQSARPEHPWKTLSQGAVAAGEGSALIRPHMRLRLGGRRPRQA